MVTGQSAALAGLAARSALLERERELAVLRTVIGEVAGGRSRVVVVEGEAGIGKTRLLVEARRLAVETGLRVLSARGGELEREFAFGVVRQLFEPGLAVGDGSLLEGAAAAARGVFEPGNAAAGAGRSDDPSFAALHGLYWLTVNLSAQGPVVIVVDDLHWCDSPSLRFLAYLTRRLEGLPVLVLGTLRPSEQLASAPLGEIVGDPLSVSVRPAPLSEQAAARLVAARLGESAEEAFWTACHAATGGNPLLLHELLTTLEAEGVPPDLAHVPAVADIGPRGVSRAVLVRLARLSRAAVAVARAVAVLGDDAELATVATFAGMEFEEAGRAAAELVGAEVLRDGALLGFVHPVVGSAVLGDMSTLERGLGHERAARLLADTGAGVERVAAHLLLSPTRGDAWVLDTLLAAARSSVGKGAADSAVAYLARALREPPSVARRPELLLELGRAETLTSGAAAVEHLSQAYELLDDAGARAAAAQLLVRTLLLTGRSEKAARFASRAAAQLPAGMDDARATLEALELTALVMGGSDAAAGVRLARYRGRPVGAGCGAKMLAAAAAHEWMMSGGACGPCAELAREALAGGELIREDTGLLAVEAIMVLALADREDALEAWEAALAEAHRRGSLVAKKSVSLWWGLTLYWRGELADAEASIRSSREGRQWGLGASGWLYSDAVFSAVLREQGDLVAARGALEGSADPGDASTPTRFWLCSQLELLVAEGRFDDAVAVAETFARRFGHLRNPADTPWRTPAALALHHAGRPREARALAEEELEYARRWGAPGALSRALRVLGTVEEDGIERLREAVDVAASSPARLEHAKSLAALGAALRRARRPADARPPLREALELADILGAGHLAGQARSELHAAGGRARTRAVGGVAALTPSEQRVAARAAAGHTNRRIAQELFVTPKTVELHLSNVYRKLGISSRRELPDQLIAAGTGREAAVR